MDPVLALNEFADVGTTWAVEAPIAHHKGTRAAFLAGWFNGLIRGIASASGIDYRPYLPVQWRKSLGTPSTLDRAGLKRWAKEFSGLKHDGEAEAYCVAYAHHLATGEV